MAGVLSAYGFGKPSSICDRVVICPGMLRAREEELDRKLLSLPVVISQSVEVELIKRAQAMAPWLIPLIIRNN